MDYNDRGIRREPVKIKQNPSSSLPSSLSLPLLPLSLPTRFPHFRLFFVCICMFTSFPSSVPQCCCVRRSPSFSPFLTQALPSCSFCSQPPLSLLATASPREREENNIEKTSRLTDSQSKNFRRVPAPRHGFGITLYTNIRIYDEYDVWRRAACTQMHVLKHK